MAKNLTDLTARTATADTDLLHINANGTDYKQTKADFKKDLCQRIGLANDSDITTQVENLATGTYCGYINSYQHQTETGMPANDTFWLYIDRSGPNNIRIEAKRLSANGNVYYKIKTTSGWGDWVQNPSRAEIDAIFKRIVLFNFNLASGGTAKHSLADHVPYGNQSGVVFLQPRGFTVNNISKIYMFRFNQAKTACYFTDVTSGVTSSLSARLDSDGNFYNTSTEYSVTYDCALFLLYY